MTILKTWFNIPRWILLLGALTAIGPLSIDMYLPAFPSMAKAFQTTPQDIELTLSFFLLGLSLGQLAYGPLSDRFGRKPPLYVGLSLYIIASLACAIAPNIETLTLARFVQALGASAGMVIARAVVRDRSDIQTSAQAMSYMTLIMGAAPILAPLLGGVLLLFTSWRLMFAFMLIIGGLLLWSVRYRMEESIQAQHQHKISFLGILKTYLTLFFETRFIRYALAGAFTSASLFAYIITSPSLAITHFHLSSQAFSILFASNALVYIICSQINARLLTRRQPQQIVNVSTWIMPSLGIVVLILYSVGYESIYISNMFFMLFMATMGFISPNVTAIALAHQAHRAGAASALMGSLQFAFGTLAGLFISVIPLPGSAPITLVMTFSGVFALILSRKK